MKCQFVSKSSSVDGPRYTVSTSFGGAAVLSETLIHNNDIGYFRIFVQKEDDKLSGWWMTLWQEFDDDEKSHLVQGRMDYQSVINALHKREWSSAQKMGWLRERLEKYFDLDEIITGRL